MEELSDLDKRDILRNNNNDDVPQTFENVPVCSCGSLNLTWNSDGTYTCVKCNKTLKKSNMNKINYHEYQESNMAKELNTIRELEDTGSIFIMG